jgi:hypothetical protein
MCGVKSWVLFIETAVSHLTFLCDRACDAERPDGEHYGSAQAMGGVKGQG